MNQLEKLDEKIKFIREIMDSEDNVKKMKELQEKHPELLNVKSSNDLERKSHMK